MKRKHNILLNLISALFIAIIVMINVNNGLFLHTHKTADGRTIVHAHAYSKKDANGKPVKHHHTKDEEQFIDSLDHSFLDVSAPVSIKVYKKVLALKYSAYTYTLHGINAPIISLRGPPICA